MNLNELKKQEENKEFDELYSKYEKLLENYSKGLTMSNKSEFLKMYAFYITVIEPINRKYLEALFKQKF